MFSSTFTMTVYDELKAHLNEEVPAGFVQVRGGKEILGYVKKDWAMAVASRTSDWRLTEHMSLSEEAEVTPTKRAAAMIHAACGCSSFCVGPGLLPGSSQSGSRVRFADHFGAYDRLLARRHGDVCQTFGN